MSSGMKLLIGVILFLILGWFGIHSGMTNGLPGGGGADLAEQKLGQKANAALVAAGISGVTVSMNGQKATITGSVPSKEIQKKAHDAVLASDWNGGLFAGGTTVVRSSALKVSEPVKNPHWMAKETTGDGVILSGYVADAKSRAAILAKAEAMYPGKVTDNMKLAPGAFAGALVGKLALFEKMGSLEDGASGLKDGKFWLSGEAANKAAGATIGAGLNALAKGYSGSADLTWPKPIANKFGVAVDEGAINDSAQCQSLFADALSKNKIEFASSSSEIGASSHEFLDFLSDLAGKCASYSLRVDGHTDNTGPRAFNIHLSAARAQSVLEYLTIKGVAASRLSSAGHGPDKPACNENTSGCRAINRRIEITVQQ